MKIRWLSTFGLRLGFLTIIIIVSNIGCIRSPQSQSFQTSTEPISNATNTVETTGTQEIIPQPSLTPTLSPTSTFTLQPSIVGTTQPTKALSEPIDTATPTTDITVEMLEQVNKDRALTDLRRITGEEPICIDNKCYTIKNRQTGGEGLRWAENYIFNELVNLGYSVKRMDWVNSGHSDQNIIATKPGAMSTDEKIFFVAHLDGVKKGLLDRFPTSDDNARGVVDLIELARILSSYSFNRSVILFFSTGEEQGTLGVRSYLSQLSQSELSSIKYVVDIDVVGNDVNQDGVMELWHGGDPQSLDLAEKLSEIIQSTQLNLSPDLVVGCG